MGASCIGGIEAEHGHHCKLWFIAYHPRWHSARHGGSLFACSAHVVRVELARICTVGGAVCVVVAVGRGYCGVYAYFVPPASCSLVHPVGLYLINICV